MTRALAAVFGDGHGSHAIDSSALQLSGTLLMLCLAAAILSAVVIGLFGKGKKKKICADAKPNKPSNVIIFTGYSCSPSDGSCGNTLKEAGGAGGGGASGGGKGSGCGGGNGSGCGGGS